MPQAQMIQLFLGERVQLYLTSKAVVDLVLEEATRDTSISTQKTTTPLIWNMKKNIESRC